VAFVQAALGPAEARRLAQKRARAKKASQLKRARRDAAAFIEYAFRDEETGGVVRNEAFHQEWQDFLAKHDCAALIAPVEHGKTQQLIGKVLHLLGNNPSLRIAVISNTAEQGQKLLRSIRTHIERNERVHEVFPNLKPSSRDEDPWHQTAITVERPTIAKDPSVQAHGVFGPVVGARLDVIVLDDVLDFENTRTEEQRKKLLEWFDTTVFTRATQRAKIWAIGTPWHPMDFLHELEKRPGFQTKRYCAVANPLADSKHWEPIWPSRWPVSRLEGRRDNMAETVFSRKYLCQVRMDATSRFRTDWMRDMNKLGKGRTFYPDAPKAQGGIRSLPCFTGVDLGVGEKKENALSVLFTIALMDDMRRLVVNIEAGRWQAPEIVDRIESHYRRFGSVIFVESNGAQKFIVDMARDKSIPVDAFHTGGINKWDPEWGVESLAVEMRNRLWVMPSGATGEAVPSEGREWQRECLDFNPTEHTGDRLMASWLAREALRKHSARKTGYVDTQSR
jgi:hypothetical protein